MSAVEALSKMIARFEKHPDEARPIFVHGVKDLALPHSPVPLIEWKESANKPAVTVPDWSAMPDGSFVLVDEAQTFFPPRPSASTPPPHIAWLNTHRHRGFDIEVITQHPKLIDGSMRALVGKHQHFRRLWGRKFAVCYEWDACSDNLAGLKNATKTSYPFPKRAFEWYKSAETHTKQKFKLPSFVFIPLIGLAIGVFAIPRAFSVMQNGITGKGVGVPIDKAVMAAVPSASSPASVVAPAIAGASAPTQSLLDKAVAVVSPPAIRGCMLMAGRCSCVNEKGLIAAVEPQVCVESSTKLGGLIPYDVNHRPTPVAATELGAEKTASADSMHISQDRTSINKSPPISTNGLVHEAYPR